LGYRCSCFVVNRSLGLCVDQGFTSMNCELTAEEVKEYPNCAPKLEVS